MILYNFAGTDHVQEEGDDFAVDFHQPSSGAVHESAAPARDAGRHEICARPNQTLPEKRREN